MELIYKCFLNLMDLVIRLKADDNSIIRLLTGSQAPTLSTQVSMTCSKLPITGKVCT